MLQGFCKTLYYELYHLFIISIWISVTMETNFYFLQFKDWVGKGQYVIYPTIAVIIFYIGQ